MKIFWLPSDRQFSFRKFRNLNASTDLPRLVATNYLPNELARCNASAGVHQCRYRRGWIRPER